MLVSIMLVVVGIIHALPVIGVLGSERLAALYGIACDEPNLAILMRHRAVLFGILAGLTFVAAVHVPLRLPMLIADAVSVLSFLMLARGCNAQLRRVVVADWIATACLLVGAVGYVLDT